jgi:hypothetical protein
MSEANINDRDSIERVYPREAFDEDLRANMLPNAEVLHGARVESGADASGRFRLARATQPVGEESRLRHTVFLAPFAAVAAADADDDASYGGAEAAPGAVVGDYDAFLERIVAAAKEADARPAPGRDDERLKGFRGG